MSATSQIVVGLDKHVYVECQLLQNLPTLLSWAHAHDEIISETEGQPTTSAMYWRIQCNWYDFPHRPTEVKQFIDWLNWLEERCKESDEETIYGASRIGETDDDHETWGNPYAFEIYREIVISAPI